MKTLQILKAKTKYNWFYLMLACVIFYAVANLNPARNLLPFNSDSYEFNSMRIWLCVAGMGYIINWLYGIIYFPMKYKKILREIYVPEIEITDASSIRGVLPALITIFAIFTNLTDYSNIWLYLWAALWLAVHFFLANLCRTDSLFTVTSIMIDETVLMPWLDSGSDEKHKFANVEFALPVNEDQKIWTRRMIISYVSHQRNWYMNASEEQKAADRADNAKNLEKIRRAENRATLISKKIYEEIK